MVLGFYYLTTPYEANLTRIFFMQIKQVLYAYQRKIIHLHQSIWLLWLGRYEGPNPEEEVSEIIIQRSGQTRCIQSSAFWFQGPYGHISQRYIRTTPGRILFHELLAKSEQKD